MVKEGHNMMKSMQELHTTSQQHKDDVCPLLLTGE